MRLRARGRTAPAGWTGPARGPARSAAPPAAVWSAPVNTTISSQSKTTEYSFVWENFSLIQGNQIVFGDVFSVNNFFAQLYGDAALQISYPSTFSVKSVTPTPYQRDDSDQILDWARTQDLVNGKTSIILTSAPANQNSTLNGWQQYAIIGIIVAVGVGLWP